MTISIDHVPGNLYVNYTLHNFALSDASEVFVFLAGWAMRLVADGSAARSNPGAANWRLVRRSGRLYVSQIVFSLLALAILVLGAVVLNAPFLYDWNAAGTVFADPVRGLIGLATLLTQLGYFNILPLYVILMLMAPVMITIYRRWPMLLLPASLALYAVVLASRFNLPNWPAPGSWFLNPFAWQLNFVLGFSIAGKTGIGAFARRFRWPLFVVSLPILALGLLASQTHFAPISPQTPWIRLFVAFNKTYESPARLINMLALAAVVPGIFEVLHRVIAPVTSAFAKLGRNSLSVFCVGSLASLVGQIYRYVVGGGALNDTLILVCTFLVLWITAWYTEDLSPRWSLRWPSR
ncbi:MAG: OpgC domain-containing protein [Hyphomicrobiales bacterium]|nr:OpgC domain-containing protein [Hyphomicrobiales bacterium]